MKWAVFSFTLPSRTKTAARVRFWRRLRRIGAVSPKLGLYVLPHSQTSIETFRGLASEIEQEKGDVVLMQVEQFENLPDSQIVDIFKKERLADYTLIQEALNDIEKKIATPSTEVKALLPTLARLKKKVETISEIDFFHTMKKTELLETLSHLKQVVISAHLIFFMMLSVATLNSTVLRRMREEANNGVLLKTSVKMEWVLFS